VFAIVSRGVAGKFRESPEMPGNKREQTATRRNMKLAAEMQEVSDFVGAG
jgi:hypothetical protein